MIRPMGDFKVSQRIKDGFFNVTELIKLWFSDKNPSFVLSEFEKENDMFLKEMNTSIHCKDEEVYLPYHIFVEFVRWCNPMYFIYAFNLCEDDEDRMMCINEKYNVFITSKHIVPSRKKKNRIINTL